MIKEQEISDPNSCLNRAKPGEMVFVLRAHDICAPETIRQWIRLRIHSGKNDPNDRDIIEAENCAAAMAEQRQYESMKRFLDRSRKSIEADIREQITDNTPEL